MEISKTTHSAAEAEQMLRDRLAEHDGFFDRVIIAHPWHRHKVISRKVHKSGDQFWVQFNRCRCWIMGATTTTIDDHKTIKYYIGY